MEIRRVSEDSVKATEDAMDSELSRVVFRSLNARVNGKSVRKMLKNG